MKKIYISPIIEMMIDIADEEILAGSNQATDGFGNNETGNTQDDGGNVTDIDGDDWNTLSKDQFGFEE